MPALSFHTWGAQPCRLCCLAHYMPAPTCTACGCPVAPATPADPCHMASDCPLQSGNIGAALSFINSCTSLAKVAITGHTGLTGGRALHACTARLHSMHG